VVAKSTARTNLKLLKQQKLRVNDYKLDLLESLAAMQCLFIFPAT